MQPGGMSFPKCCLPAAETPRKRFPHPCIFDATMLTFDNTLSHPERELLTSGCVDTMFCSQFTGLIPSTVNCRDIQKRQFIGEYWQVDKNWHWSTRPSSGEASAAPNFVDLLKGIISSQKNSPGMAIPFTTFHFGEYFLPDHFYRY